MTRREWVVLAVAAAGCSSAPRPLEEALPAKLEQGWTLTGTEPLPAASAPETARALGLRRALRATYRGPAAVRVTLYDMSTGAGAFELAQKWKPAPGVAYFHHDRYFVTVESAELSQQALVSFAGLLDRRLK